MELRFYMARRLFFVSEVHSGFAELRGEEARHLSKVLRVEAGQQYELSDGESLYLAEVAAAHKEMVRFQVLEKLPVHPEPYEVTLAMALVKFDRLEWILEKATELGATHIRPFWSDRSEHGLERAAPKRLERWRRILVESCQQSRRVTPPEIYEPVSFESILAKPTDRRYFFDERREDSEFAPQPAASTMLIIGPEGGWTDRERNLAKDCIHASLGPRILRAETAAIAVLAILGNRLRQTPGSPAS
jgi:16S rRNA (uracil1498-N3)-methyltransferase